jgi:hypothetical protein
MNFQQQIVPSGHEKKNKNKYHLLFWPYINLYESAFALELIANYFLKSPVPLKHTICFYIQCNDLLEKHIKV